MSIIENSNCDFSGTSSPLYSQFIHLSRYSRWLDSEKRRENWSETVQRYLDFWKTKLPDHADEIQNLFSSIYNLEVMPSMRCLMTAGKALERDEVAGYNCAYMAIDNPRAFDEMMYILMCGTGVGFSVERQFVSKLPDVAEEFHDSETIITVRDSKIGWATAFRELISLLYVGQIPKWDLSNLRPAGAKLKTMGGRSSGPEPLDRLFKFCINLFRKAGGRKLSSIECHDIACMIGDVVVVGGVRRSALISLSNLSDDRMRLAKSGQWWNEHPHRALANNSVVYSERPDFEIFLNEWLSLYASKSGERGIFSRPAAKKQVAKYGRRDPNHEFGCNPCCVSPDTLIMTVDGPRRIDSLDGVPFEALVNGKKYSAPKGSWMSGVGKIYRLETDSGYEIELTQEHQILTKNRGWVQAKDLTQDDLIVINNHSEITWPGKGSWNEGYILGAFLGDGNFINPKIGSAGEVKVWKKDEGSIGIEQEIQKCSSCLVHRSDWLGWRDAGLYKKMSIGKLPLQFGMDWGNKHINEKIETASCDFQRGFLRGLFDTDGHIEGSQEKGWSIRLGQSNILDLKAVQKMLLRLGIKSKIRAAKEEGQSLLPDGRGGKRLYDTMASWRLIISSNDIKTFQQRVGLSHLSKKEKLDNIVNSISFYSKDFVTKLKSFEYVREGEVWDAEISEVHAFDANGIYAHNSEIFLRSNQFCNLSEIVVRSNDTMETLLKKAEFATILGTIQSTLTNFRYLRKVWQKNTEEERLLGVSMTGIMDCDLLNNPDDPELPKRLEQLRLKCVETNKLWATKLGIPESAAISCVKPSGCRPSNALVTSNEGIFELGEFDYSDGAWTEIKELLSGDYGRIMKSFSNGLSPLININMSFGMQLQSTPNHKWMVSKKGWVRADELKQGDEIVLNLNAYSNVKNYILKEPNFECLHHNVNKNITWPKEIVPDFAWLLGYIWGDGAMCEDKSRFRFVDGNLQVIEKAKSIFYELFQLSAEIKKLNDRNAWCMEIASRALWDGFEKNNLIKPKTKSLDKIPLAIRMGSVESLCAFLSGLVDSDGCVSNTGNGHSLIITTSQEKFARHIQQVALSFGQVFSLSVLEKRKGSYENSGPMYHLSHCWGQSTEHKNMFNKHSVKMNGKENPKSNSRSSIYKLGLIKSTSLGEVAPTFDVETEQHWFWAGAFMSHNTVSQLVDAASGIHPRFDKHYIRRVRIDKKDPLGEFLRMHDFPHEEDKFNSSVWVFEFPMAAPQNSRPASTVKAMEQLKLWKIFQDNWCEHKPSITVYYRDHEFLEIGSWIWNNFDNVSGIAFLPYSDHVYIQAPYESISKEKYEDLLKKMPKDVNWENLALYEAEDNTAGTQSLACVAGQCDVVDLVKFVEEEVRAKK